jgi:hypothetical protein
VITDSSTYLKRDPVFEGEAMNIKRLILTGMIASAVLAPLASHSIAQAGYPAPHESKWEFRHEQNPGGHRG